MKILFIGDIVGNASCDYLAEHLADFKHKNNIDIVIANGENASDGNGILPGTASRLLNIGIDVITTGNHCFKRKEINDFLEESDLLLRPANLGTEAPGKGWCELDYGAYKVAVVNLQGVSFMMPIDNPFKAADEILSKITAKTIIVDFHAEATSEKKAFGFYLQNRVSAVLGTHTHVQTADETVLSDFTGYITDVGMTGVQNSVLGIDPSIIIERLTTNYPKRYKYAVGEIKMDAVILEIEKNTGRCLKITRV